MGGRDAVGLQRSTETLHQDLNKWSPLCVSDGRTNLLTGVRMRGGDMKVKGVFCGHKLNLDHCVFDNYTGSVKCFSCSRIMEVRTARGIACSKYPLAIFETKRNLALVKMRD